MYLLIKNSNFPTRQAKVMGYRSFNVEDGITSLYLAKLSNNSYVVINENAQGTTYQNYTLYSSAYLAFTERLGFLESKEREIVLSRPRSRIGLI